MKTNTLKDFMVQLCCSNCNCTDTTPIEILEEFPAKTQEEYIAKAYGDKRHQAQMGTWLCDHCGCGMYVDYLLKKFVEPRYRISFRDALAPETTKYETTVQEAYDTAWTLSLIFPQSEICVEYEDSDMQGTLEHIFQVQNGRVVGEGDRDWIAKIGITLK